MNGLVGFLSERGGDVAMVAALTVLLVSAAVAAYAAFAPGDPLKARLYEVMAAQRGQVTPDSKRRRDMRSLSSLSRLIESMKLTRGKDARHSADLLLQAGWRTPEALVIYSAIRLALPLGFGILTLIFVTPLDFAPVSRLGLGIIGAMVGLYLPVAVLRGFIAARHKELRHALPDALDLMVICAESGLGLDGALSRVARELSRFAPTMAEELYVAGLELGFLPNRRDAFQNLVTRVDIPPMRSFVNTLIQTERYGTPLAQALKLLSGDMREERMLKMEEKAAKIPAFMTVPMIVFILPAMFMLLIGPAMVAVFKSFQ